MNIKAITIRQPWAYLIAAGFKDVENREINRNRGRIKYRGVIYIHAGKKTSTIRFTQAQEDEIDRHPGLREEIEKAKKMTGMIIGKVEFVNCVRNSDSLWATNGMIQIVLKNAKLFNKPLENVSGRPSIPWNYETSDDFVDNIG